MMLSLCGECRCVTPQKMAAKETTGAVMNEDLLTIFSLVKFLLCFTEIFFPSQF